MGNEFFSVGKGHQRFIGYERYWGCLLEALEVRNRSAGKGLFDRSDVEGNKGVEHRNGLVQGPGAVGVDPQRHLGSQHFADRLQACDITFHSYLNLDVFKSDELHLADVLQRLLQRACSNDTTVDDLLAARTKDLGG